jgi:ribosome recycling factor
MAYILDNIYQEAKKAMVKPIMVLEEEFKKIRGAKASPSMIENCKVEIDQKFVPLKNISSISTPDARTIIISPWENKTLSAIEKAILKENINITPQNDGKVVKLILPQLTEETRKELVKTIKQKCEEAKVAIRNIRRDYLEKLKKLEKDGEISEDDSKEGELKIQEFTNKAIKKVDEMFKEKEKDIMTI